MKSVKKESLTKAVFLLLSLALLVVMLAFFLHCFYNYFYPMTYSEEIKALGDEYKIESALIASVANAESGFDEKAVSSKGAMGVMQLMPSTAKWLSQKLGVEFSEEKLLEGEYSLTLGAYYLAYLMEVFENKELALCAYNAGPSKVHNWLEDKACSSDGKTLDKIPYKETENYLNKVMKNYRYYSKKYH